MQYIAGTIQNILASPWHSLSTTLLLYIHEFEDRELESSQMEQRGEIFSDEGGGVPRSDAGWSWQELCRG